MKVQDFINSGGRIARIKEQNSKSNRTITIAYMRVDGFIEYGATIHRQNAAADQFNRKAHNATAVARFANAPVWVADIEVERSEQRETFLRECLRDHGCFTNDQPWLNPLALTEEVEAIYDPNYDLFGHGGHEIL